MNYTCRAVLLKSFLLPRLFYYLDQHIFSSQAMLSVDGRPMDVLNVGVRADPISCGKRKGDGIRGLSVVEGESFRRVCGCGGLVLHCHCVY